MLRFEDNHLGGYLTRLAMAAAQRKLIALPEGFLRLTPKEQGEYAAWLCCRIRSAATQGDVEADRFCKTFSNISAHTPIGPDLSSPSRLKRVGILTPGLELGGAERWCLSLAKYIDWGRLQRVGIACLGSGDATLVAEAETICPLIKGKGAGRVLAACCDTILAWGVPHLDMLGDFKGRVITVSQGCGEPTRQMLAGCVAKTTDQCAVSDASATAWPDPSKVTIIRNGADVTRCKVQIDRVQMRKQLGLKPEEKVIGYMGRFNWDKQPLAAAKAAAALGPGHRAFYAGDGLHRVEVLTKVRELCPDAVIAPRHDQVGDYLNAIDCFVLTSKSEGMSIALTEAWYCGTPTVASRVGAVPELEELHGQLCVPFKKDLAADCRLAMSAENQPVVDRAREVVTKYYTTDAMCQKWTDFLLR